MSPLAVGRAELALLLEAAHEVATLTGAVAQHYYEKHLSGGDLGVSTKKDGSPVSRADRESEQAARDFLARRFPDDGVLGEELGAHKPDAKRRWCIDPIDGTRSFLAGSPLWGSLVALVEGEEVLAGAAAFPAVGTLIAAAPGLGCHMDGPGLGATVAGQKLPAHVSQVAELSRAVVLTTDERFTYAPQYRDAYWELGRQVGTVRTWGDCFGYWLVATGKAEVMIDGIMNPWDAACFIPIIEEAGGVVTDWQGKRTAFGSGLIATNRTLASETRRILGVPSTADEGNKR